MAASNAPASEKARDAENPSLGAAMLIDNECAPIVREFAESEAVFVRDYSEAHRHLSECNNVDTNKPLTPLTTAVPTFAFAKQNHMVHVTGYVVPVPSTPARVHTGTTKRETNSLARRLIDCTC